METYAARQHLSQIDTRWSLVLQSHQSYGPEAGEARAALLKRYGGPVFDYLAGILRDADSADELAQEFALRFLRGDFRRVNPACGRFRDFLKMVLRHMVIDYRRQRARGRGAGAAEVEIARVVAPSREDDERFLAAWRADLLSRAWRRLADAECRSREPLYRALRCKAEHPELRSAQLADQLSRQLGQPFSAAGIRQTLHRARARFADYLLDEVAASLAEPSRENIEEELCDLGLLSYCTPALERRWPSSGAE
jgi:RNA polymerase sigma-70 factor (ECF subfamily)